MRNPAGARLGEEPRLRHAQQLRRHGRVDQHRLHRGARHSVDHDVSDERGKRLK
jgi:hypothetical protein